MGREVIELAREREGVTVALAVNRSTVDTFAGIDVRTLDDESDLTAQLSTVEPDVLVDFTAPEATVEYVGACIEAGVPVVTGTTGFDDDQQDRLEAAAATIPLLVASNFSRGILALRRAIREAVQALPGYDAELTETHHNGKRDAPSGTATTILADIEEATNNGDTSDRVHGREGDQPRTAGEIGVHARRAGDITGEHELLLAGNREALELTHRAGDRGVFAAGALDAAAWLAGRDPGRYEFADVVDDGTDSSDPSTEATAEATDT